MKSRHCIARCSIGLSIPDIGAKFRSQLLSLVFWTRALQYYARTLSEEGSSMCIIFYTPMTTWLL